MKVYDTCTIYEHEKEMNMKYRKLAKNMSSIRYKQMTRNRQSICDKQEYSKSIDMRYIKDIE